jgi:hypothetical protein
LRTVAAWSLVCLIVALALCCGCAFRQPRDDLAGISIPREELELSSEVCSGRILTGHDAARIALLAGLPKGEGDWHVSLDDRNGRCLWSVSSRQWHSEWSSSTRVMVFDGVTSEVLEDWVEMEDARPRAVLPN